MTKVIIRTPGPQGPPGAGTIFLRVAETNLSGHRIVVPSGGDSVAYANPADTGHAVRPHWLTLGAALAGALVSVAAFGEVQESSWAFAPGAALYLGPNGLLTETPPTSGYVLQVAVAQDSDEIYFDPRIPIIV